MDPEEEEEYYAIPVPETAEEGDILVVNIVTPEEADAIFANSDDEDEDEEDQ